MTADSVRTRQNTKSRATGITHLAVHSALRFVSSAQDPCPCSNYILRYKCRFRFSPPRVGRVDVGQAPPQRILKMVDALISQCFSPSDSSFLALQNIVRKDLVVHHERCHLPLYIQPCSASGSTFWVVEILGHAYVQRRLPELCPLVAFFFSGGTYAFELGL